MTIRLLPVLLWLAVIAFLSLMPGDDLPHTGVFGIPHLDKAIHAGMYSILAVLLAIAYPPGKLRSSIVLVAFTLAFGGLMEILQATVAVNRSAGWDDLIANGTGAILGLLIFYRFSPPLLNKIKAWKINREKINRV